MRVAVVGLGKIGLPLAVQFASSGHTVIGLDVQDRVANTVNWGLSPFPGEPGLDQELKRHTDSGKLRASLDIPGGVSQSEVVVVTVPLLVDSAGQVDFSSIDAAIEEIGRGLQRNTLVCIETTVPIGSTRQRFAPALARYSSLQAGRDFFVVYSPERVSSGRVFEDLRNYPKLLGGIDQASASRGVEFYSSAINFSSRNDLPRRNGVWDLESAESAEFAKLAETTYRDVNIGLANQFARYADQIGIDFYSVIEACNSQPFSHIHQPGIAVGGHCIPVYPHLYLMGDNAASIVQTARAANSEMPSYAVQMLSSFFGSLSNKKVAVLGAAYRGGVKETAFSGVFPLVAELTALGADPVVHDPLYTELELLNLGLKPFQLGAECDAVIIQTDHELYKGLNGTMLPGARVIIDGRRVITDLSTFAVPVMQIGNARDYWRGNRFAHPG